MYRALISFTGLISMAEGEVKDITDKAIVEDLLKANYIEEVTPAEKPKKKSTAKRKKKAVSE